MERLMPDAPKEDDGWIAALPQAYAAFVCYEADRLGISGSEVIRTALSRTKEWTAFRRVLDREDNLYPEQRQQGRR
jgi:hypothetical protein